MKSIDRNKIEQFLQWEGGQRLFNFAYSIGAAIVILGALFKILHLAGGNTLLMIGMGTEVLMFILTAFDRPPQEYKWENVYPSLVEKKDSDPQDEATATPQDDTTVSQGNVGGGTIIIGGGNTNSVSATVDGIVAATAGSKIPSGDVVAAGEMLSPNDAAALSETIQKMSAAAEQLTQFTDLTQATRDYMTQMASIADQLHRLNETTRSLNQVSEVLLDSYRAITENSENITRSSSGYVEQMQALNHNVQGLNTIYEIQLKSVSSQLDSIDRVNRGIKDIRDMYEKSADQSARYCEETEKMARYMKQLNRVYENMIHAMTVNMYRPMAGMQMPGEPEPTSDN